MSRTSSRPPLAGCQVNCQATPARPVNEKGRPPMGWYPGNLPCFRA